MNLIFATYVMTFKVSSISSIWVGFSFVAEIPNQITKNWK